MLSTLGSRYKCIRMKKNDAVKLNCFNFTITRNPYSRIVSCYNFLVGAEGFDIRHNTYKGMSFEEFVKVICDTKDRDSNSHFKSLSEHHKIKGKLNYFNFVGKLENIEKDFKRILEILKVEDMEMYHRNKTNHKSWEEYYTDELKRMVYNRYKGDFKFGGYER